MPQRIVRARRETPDARLARLLDSPQLMRAVPRLAPELLHRVIRQRGLDVCGDLVAAATPEQLTRVFDLDLWRPSEPGRDERFDADRFGDWLDLLAEAGDDVSTRILATMDVELAIAGLSRHVRVFDLGVFEPTAASDDEAMEPIVESDLTCELGGYRVLGRRGDAWDAIVALLLALETEYPHRFHELMQGCRLLSDSAPEVDGLDELLTEPEQQMYDLAGERERRRSQQGYGAPADARAFLALARRHRRDRSDERPSANAIAAAYFRAADDTEAPAPGSRGVRRSQPAEKAAPSRAVSRVLGGIVELFGEAGLAPESPRALPGSGVSVPRLAHIQPLMQRLVELDEAAWLERHRELAFLANMLVAGCSFQSRPFTPGEASDAVIAVCNLGLEQWPARWPSAGTRDAASTAGPLATLPDAFLGEHDLVTAFEAGWSTLHEDVSMYAARRLAMVLEGLQCTDADLQQDLRALERELRTQCENGTPWRMRDSLDVIAMLDTPAWVCLLGILDECPVIPDALTATLEGRKSAVSATSFQFISTAAQIDEARAFLARLPGLLI